MGDEFIVVGYVYVADVVCPDCIGQAVTSNPQYDGWQLADGVRTSAEQNLDEIAEAFGINRNDESSFDSSDFPKVITQQMADHDNGWSEDGPYRCACGSSIDGE